MKRKSLSKKERLDSEKSLVQLWESVGDSYNTNKVALYWPVNGEISTISLISNFLKDGSECFLPIISQNKKNKILEFALFEIDNPLTNNRFDIPEPRKSTIVDLNELDVIFLALCMFLTLKETGLGWVEDFTTRP